ncbi:hypothetical protein BJ875DRAFT_495019 [Amylocarpus encephaloides]|uniref:Jacalin-type lectin domain-containing protein n=1 Tax=Amylocarpus encephaloides TaxID=45428 RepID=A0A9P8C6N0_9HELO|nr:hypothetical protein BJ875DRAFT_495019 [Amylocarpus encephaloides]
MRFYTQAVMVGVASLLSLATAAGDCEKGPYAPTISVGADDIEDSPKFCWAEYDQGLVVVGLEVWAARFHIKGVKMTMSDGSNRMIGQQQVDPQGGNERIAWGIKDKVTALKMWKNKDKKGLGKIEIEISNGKKLVCGNQKETSHDGPELIDPAGGTILGAKGAAGAWLENLGFLFLRSTIDEADIIDVKFDENMDQWNAEGRGIRSQDFGNSYFVNQDPPGSPNATFKFSNSKIVTSSKTLTQSSTHVVGAEVSVKVGGKVGVPFVAEGSIEVTATAKYSFERMNSEATTNTETRTIRWDWDGSIAPGKATHCKATAQSGEFSSPYTSTVNVHMVDGTTFEIKQKGDFISTGWTQATGVCGEIDIKDVPKGSLIIDSKASSNDDGVTTDMNRLQAVSVRAVSFQG